MSVIKILIVDDNEMDRVLASHLLSDLFDFVYATDGVEGLTMCDSVMPDLVITDMLMPNMGGMEMLTELQKRYPEIPVIMMTADGSESTAAEAIRRGAISYVPKRQLPERLKETVDQVLELTQANRDYARLLERLEYSRYRYEFENDFSIIEPLVEFVQQIAFVRGACGEGTRHQIGIALDEALFNAMYHGNLELPPESSQQVRSHLRNGDAGRVGRQATPRSEVQWSQNTF